MILIIYIYSTQRIIKDSLIITNLGAELISTIKLWAVLPLAIITMLIYAKLSDIFKKTQLFHLLNIFFISYFLLFTFIIQPNINYFTFNLQHIKDYIPYLRYMFMMIENWSYILYYILSELWGSVMLSLMFWQISNKVFKIEQAKRIYPLLGMVGQLGMLMSGQISYFFTNKSLFSTWIQSLKYINISVLFASLILSILFFLLCKYIISYDEINIKKNNKKKMSFIDGLKHVFTSKYIGLIASLILCYGVSINLVEGVWKAQTKILNPDMQSYTAFMSRIQYYTGICSMIAMYCSSYIISSIPWKYAALFTPFMIFITGTIFFIFSIYKHNISYIFTFITAAPIIITVFVGSFQNILSKATKYAFFDPTKEIAYIPLNENLKSKGKAAADVIGGRLGKSGGAFIQWLLLLNPTSNLINISHYLFLIFIIIMIIWIFAVSSLAKEFKKAEGI